MSCAFHKNSNLSNLGPFTATRLLRYRVSAYDAPTFQLTTIFEAESLTSPSLMLACLLNHSRTEPIPYLLAEPDGQLSRQTRRPDR